MTPSRRGRRRVSAAAKIALAVATAASGIIAVPVAEGATAECPAGPGPGRSVSRVSDDPERAPGSWGAHLSDDGRFVAFISHDDKLVAGDDDQEADVFRADRVTGEIVGVRVDTEGSDSQGHVAEASIGGDGSRVAFSSLSQVYVRDIGPDHTVRVSVTGSGAPADGWSGAPVLSSDGRFVAFTSRATNLVASDRTGGSLEAYVRDLSRGATERISIGPGGLPASTWSWAGAVSDGGRDVAFTAGAAGGSLGADDTYPGADVFVRDREAQVTEQVSVGPDGRTMGGWFLGMSADGTKILFGSGPQADSKPAVYIRDRLAHSTRFIAPLVITWGRRTGPTPSLAVVGQRAGRHAALSADGRLAAIQTALPTGSDDNNAADDIILVDTDTGTWQPATRSSAGCPGNGASGEPALSRDGSIVSFTSEADDIVGPDNHRATNVYVREMIGRTTERIGTTP